ncbi:hypothetical protein Esti_002908 [Eimeria stiedai]
MVVVGIVGPQRSGKRTVAAALQKLYGFKVLHLSSFGGDSGEEVSLKRGTDGAAADTQPPACFSAERQTAAAAAAMHYCMQHWKEDFLVLGFSSVDQVSVFRKRPIFLLLAVEAPITSRLQRANAQDLNAFLKEEDLLMFGGEAKEGGRGIYACMRQADASVLADGSVSALEEKLLSLNLLNPERRRPSWDAYFIRLASLAASRANCLKRRVGAIVVRNNRLVSTGYNGTHTASLNCLDGGCARCSDPVVRVGRHLEACSCIHAEANALLEAGRERCLGGTLYVTCLPCLGCAKLTIQAGIKSVVYAEAYDAESGSLELLTNAGLEVYRFADRHPFIPYAIATYAD